LARRKSQTLRQYTIYSWSCEFMASFSSCFAALSAKGSVDHWFRRSWPRSSWLPDPAHNSYLILQCRIKGPYFDAVAAQSRNFAVRDPMLVANDAFCENRRNLLKPLVRCYFWRDRAFDLPGHSAVRRTVQCVADSSRSRTT